MSLESSEAEIMPSDNNSPNAGRNLTPSQFEDLSEKSSPNAAALNAGTSAPPGNATAAAAAPAAEAPLEKKKPARSEKQQAADAGAVTEMAKLKARYDSEFANIDEKFRPKPKFPDARKLYYLKSEADKNEFINDRIKIDRAAAELRVKGKTRRNANKAVAAAERQAAREAATAAKAASSSGTTRRKLKSALNSAAALNSASGMNSAAPATAAPATAFATTRRAAKVPGSSNFASYTTALETKMREKMASQSTKMHDKLNAIATKVEESLKKTATRIADDIRKIASGATATSSKTRRRGSTTALASNSPPTDEPLSAIKEEGEETTPSSNRDESEYFG